MVVIRKMEPWISPSVTPIKETNEVEYTSSRLRQTSANESSRVDRIDGRVRSTRELFHVAVIVVVTIWWLAMCVCVCVMVRCCYICLSANVMIAL